MVEVVERRAHTKIHPPLNLVGAGQDACYQHSKSEDANHSPWYPDTALSRLLQTSHIPDACPGYTTMWICWVARKRLGLLSEIGHKISLSQLRSLWGLAKRLLCRLGLPRDPSSES